MTTTDGPVVVMFPSKACAAMAAAACVALASADEDAPAGALSLLADACDALTEALAIPPDGG